MIKTIKNIMFYIMSDTRIVCAGIIAASVTALSGALISQYVFGLEPCILCVFQRIPYVLTALLGIAGLFCLWKTKNSKAAIFCILLSALLFSGEAALAFYHVGVEQHWWKSIFEGCTGIFSGSTEDILKSLQAKPAVRCDEIPWAMFGISMAGYNVMLALGLAGGCFASALLQIKHSQKS